MLHPVPELYHPLMEDAFHVVERGNKVMGVDIARAFGLAMHPDPPTWAEALHIQRLVDRLEREEQDG